MTSVISSLRRMLLNWPDAPANTRQVLESLLAELATPQLPTAITLRGSGALAAAGCRLPAHRFLGCAISVAFTRRQPWIRRVENASAIAEFNVPPPRH